MKQFAVIGLGRFGKGVALTLESLGHQVMGIDRNPQLVARMRHHLTYAEQADCTDDDQINALGLRNFDAVVVSIAHNLQASVLVTMLLKEHGVPRVVAKASDELHGRVLAKVGADQVIYPERDMGKRVAHQVCEGCALDSIEITPDYRVTEMVAPAWMGGRSLKELNLRARFAVNVVGIRRADELLVTPRADDRVAAGDILLLMGDAGDLRHLSAAEALP